jgi:hypothetical protein
VRLRYETGLKTTLLKGFSDESRTDAAGANLYGSNAAVVFDRLDFLEVRIPDRTGLVVCMADIVSEAWAFSANFTFS